MRAASTENLPTMSTVMTPPKKGETKATVAAGLDERVVRPLWSSSIYGPLMGNLVGASSAQAISRANHREKMKRLLKESVLVKQRLTFLFQRIGVLRFSNSNFVHDSTPHTMEAIATGGTDGVSVQVIVRLRPMNDKELKGNTLPVVTASTDAKTEQSNCRCESSPAFHTEIRDSHRPAAGGRPPAGR